MRRVWIIFNAYHYSIIDLDCTLSKSLFVAQMSGDEELESRPLGVELEDDVAVQIFKNTIPNNYLGAKILWKVKTNKSDKTTDWPEMVKAYFTLNEILDATSGYIPLQKTLHLQFRQFLKETKLEWSMRDSYRAVENLRKMLQALGKLKREKGVAPRAHPKLQVLMDKIVAKTPRSTHGNESMTAVHDEVASEREGGTDSSDLELEVFGFAKSSSSSEIVASKIVAPSVQQRSHCYVQQLPKVFEVFSSLQGVGQSTLPSTEAIVPIEPKQAVPGAIVPIEPKQAVPGEPKLGETSGPVLLTADRLASLANPQNNDTTTVEGASPLLGKTPNQFKALKKRTKGKATLAGTIQKKTCCKRN